MKNISTAATEAVFHLQMNTRDAVRHVVRQTGCDNRTAEEAVANVLTGYKTR
tara:strand:+ start:124 stop:279 length:156 start_codon:yes stop_codon:yes gene_type:complete